MTAIVAVVFGVGAVLTGFAVGAAWQALGTSIHSREIWEIHTPDGHTYYVSNVDEVAAALAVDGMLAVRRLRVLT